MLFDKVDGMNGVMESAMFSSFKGGETMRVKVRSV